MTREELFRAIGEAEDGWVQAAELPPRAAKRRRWPIAAAVVLVVGLVACGVQQGWFQFLTPAQWMASTEGQQGITIYSSSLDEAADVLMNTRYVNQHRVVYPSRQLTEDAFRETAADNGWTLNWAALDGQGAFNAVAEPCWDAQQLQIERLTPRRLSLSGTPKDIPFTLTGIWRKDADTSVAVSFQLTGGKEELSIPLGEKDQRVQLDAKGWNETTLVIHDRESTFVGGETQDMPAATLFAWRPLDEPQQNLLWPQIAAQDPLQGQDVDRCVLIVQFQGYEPEEAQRLATELLKRAS